MRTGRSGSTQFGVATHACSSTHGALLEIVERMELEEVYTENLKNQMSQEQSEWMERTQSEMFRVLSLLTNGEANQLVRSCDDKNDYTAWKKLYDRFNPKDSGEPHSSMARCHHTQEDSRTCVRQERPSTREESNVTEL